jgi:antitoxin component YwqK of YwqJK toxin-antitoxin module
LLNGKSTLYYTNGNAKEVIEYKNHKADGPFIEYYLNGKIKAKGIQKDSLVMGDFFQYIDSLNSNVYTKCFIYDNNVFSDTTFVYKDDVLRGYEIYDKDGKLLREVKLKK